VSSIKSVKCDQCKQDILVDDLIIMVEKPGMAVCPLCTNDIKMEDDMSGSFEDVDTIAENIEKEWGIDSDTAYAIASDNKQDLLDQFMFITRDGDVINAADEDSLKLEMLSFLLDEEGSIAEIEYVFVDGVAKSIEIDIDFKEVEEEEDEHFVDDGQQSMPGVGDEHPGYGF
jgi:hypothetical protein